MFNETTKRSPTVRLKFDAGATHSPHDHPAREEIAAFKSNIKLSQDKWKVSDYLWNKKRLRRFAERA